MRSRFTRLLRTNGSRHGRIIVLESHSRIDCVSDLLGDSKWLVLNASQQPGNGAWVKVEVEHRVSRHAAVP